MNINIKEVEFVFLMIEGVDNNMHDKQLNSYEENRHHFIYQQKIIQKRKEKYSYQKEQRVMQKILFI